MKHAWAIAVVLIVAGAILGVVGWLLGARGFYLDRGGIHIGDNDLTHVTAVTEPFDSIAIRTATADIELIADTEFRIDIQLTGGEPLWSVSGGTLTLEAKTNTMLSFGFLGPQNYIKIYYPAGTDFRSVDLDGISSDIKIGALSADSVSIHAVSGNVTARGVTADTLKIKTTSGEITFDGSVTGGAELSAVSGNVGFKSDGDFEYELSAVSGGIRVNGKYYEKRASGGGGAPLKVKTTSGEITVRFGK
jgi:hypothetical protein